MVVRNGIAYVAVGTAGLYIVDVSDPRSPVELGSIDTPDFATDVEVVPPVAFVADDLGGLRIIDVSNPTSPIELSSVVHGIEYALDVELVGQLAYVAFSGGSDYVSGGVTIIDVSDPAAPVHLGAYSRADDVEVAGGIVYAAISPEDPGLQIVDFGPEYFAPEPEGLLLLAVGIGLLALLRRARPGPAIR